MYGRNDLRTTLAPKASPQTAERFKSASYALFYGTEPQLDESVSRTWMTRGQTMIVAYSEAEAGSRFARADQVDEYAIVLPDDDCAVDVEFGGTVYEMRGRSVAFVPAGSSVATVRGGTRLLRLFTTQSPELVAQCSNAAQYADDDPNVAPFQSWPDPVGGPKVRVYSGTVPREEGRFGRIYRGSTIMVNMGDGYVGPRKSENLSPHHHDDFEQYSIALDGNYVHHLRWPWISDSTEWLPDNHEECGSPSVAVIPPPATHTSQGIGADLNRLLDAFCPPRMDFSSKPGWVLNADDYPMPDETIGTNQ